MAGSIPEGSEAYDDLWKLDVSLVYYVNYCFLGQDDR